jgi:hypothetical protein
MQFGTITEVSIAAVLYGCSNINCEQGESLLTNIGLPQKRGRRAGGPNRLLLFCSDWQLRREKSRSTVYLRPGHEKLRTHFPTV